MKKVTLLLLSFFLVGCISQTIVKDTNNFCYDSDDGQNYNVFGGTQLFSGQPGDTAVLLQTYKDSCVDSSKLREYYCSSPILASSTLYTCPNGCEDLGAGQGQCKVEIVGEDCAAPNGNTDDWYCSGANQLFLCNPNNPSDGHWEQMPSVDYCSNCNIGIVSPNLDEVCVQSTTGCSNPSGNINDWYCDEDDVIYKCEDIWRVDGYCGDKPGFGLACKFSNTIQDTRDDLCIIDAVCRDNTACDDNNGCTIDLCKSDGTCDYSARECGSGKHCESDQCVEFSSCVSDNQCDDSNPNTEDKCVSAKCQNNNSQLNNIYIISGASVVIGGIIIYSLLRRKRK